MRGPERLREAAAFYESMADRANTSAGRGHLFGCAAELAQIAEWVERTAVSGAHTEALRRVDAFARP